METSPTSVTLPFRQRRWRTVAALIVAPCSLIPVALLEYLDYVDEGMESSFFPYVFLLMIALGYIASAVVGATASILRICFKAPLKAGVVVALFALSAGIWGLFNSGTLAEKLFLIGLLAAFSLPVSISYCAIAGVRWR